MILKRVLTAFVCAIMILMLCSCGNGGKQQDITMEQIIEANKNETLLSKNNSFSLITESSEGECEYFVNPKLRYSYDKNIHEVINEDGHFQKVDSNLYATVLYAGVEPIGKDEDLLVSKETTANEKIVECVYEDGKILLKTELPPEIYATYKTTDSEGDYLVIDYVLNEKTFEIISMTETVCKSDGTEVSVTNSKVEYNKTLPVEVNEILSKVKIDENTVQSDDTENTESDEKEKKVRTVTIVLDPGTADQKEYSVEVLVGNTVSVVRPEGYDTIYSDRTLTKKFAGDDDLESDLTLYSANGR